MAFEQAAINYAAEYGKALANAYPYLSYFPEVWGSPNSTLYRPGQGKTIYVPSMEVSGATAVDRDTITGTFNRNFNNEYQALTMAMDREWSTLVDPMDIVQTNEVVTIANITKTFNEFQKVPEMDAYASEKLAFYANGFGGVVSTSLTADNILGQWDAALAYMIDQRIPVDRIVCKMTPAAYVLLKSAAGVTRFVSIDGSALGINRNVASLDGVKITQVPKDMMKTAYTFTTGWVVTGGATQVNFILFDPMALVAPVIYDTSMMTAPTAQSKGKWLYYERYYYDIFSLNKRQAGFYANMTGVLGTLTVTSVAGTAASGDTVVTATGANIKTNGLPEYGLTLYVTSNNTSAPTVTYGAALPGTVTWAAVTANPMTIASQTAGKYVTFALVNNQTGYAVSAGSAVEVVKS